MKGIFFNCILTGRYSNLNGKMFNGTLNGIRCNGICNGIQLNGTLNGIRCNGICNGIQFNGTLNGIRCNGIFNGIRYNGIFNGRHVQWYFEQYLTNFPSMVSLLSALFRIRETTKQINGMRSYDLYRSCVNICV